MTAKDPWGQYFESEVRTQRRSRWRCVRSLLRWVRTGALALIAAAAAACVIVALSAGALLLLIDLFSLF